MRREDIVMSIKRELAYLVGFFDHFFPIFLTSGLEDSNKLFSRITLESTSLSVSILRSNMGRYSGGNAMIFPVEATRKENMLSIL